MSTVFKSVVSDLNYQEQKRKILSLLQSKLSVISKVRPPQSELKESYEQAVKSVGDLRGRDLFYKYLGSGAGHGPFVELADGSVKYDLITGIGVNFFGHGNLELFNAIFDSLWCDLMQGNLGPNPEYHELLKALVDAAGPKSRLKHAWLTTCGATANENALKLVRQKKSPASKILAFKDCFAGRTTALQEITDNPNYRQGQPTYNEVAYISYYNPRSPKSPAEQAQDVKKEMIAILEKEPDRFAVFEFELVQGEGGFNYAPREFILPLIEEAKKRGLYIWCDEIQTFGRTGEIFCFQKVGLDEWVDIVTVGKMLQTAALLYTAELNPKPGLVSGTFAGSSGSLKGAVWVLEALKKHFIGEQGRIKALEKLSVKEFQRLKNSALGPHLLDYTVYGGMIAFTVFDGSLDKTKKLLNKMFDNGAIGFYCGHGPYRVRMLPPFGVMTDIQWKEVFSIIEKSIIETA